MNGAKVMDKPPISEMEDIVNKYRDITSKQHEIVSCIMAKLDKLGCNVPDPEPMPSDLVSRTYISQLRDCHEENVKLGKRLEVILNALSAIV